MQGTCDELALDVLVNMLLGFSRDFCGLKKVYIGGVNRSWPLPEEDEEEEEPEVRGGRGEGEGGRVSMTEEDDEEEEPEVCERHNVIHHLPCLLTACTSQFSNCMPLHVCSLTSTP